MAKRQVVDFKKIDEVSDFWDVLTDNQRDYLMDNSIVQHYKKNELIHAEGDVPTHMMILVKGKVKIYKEGVGGRCQIIRMIRPVDYFGYRAIFAESTYNTNASAFESSSVYLIPKEVILSLLQSNALLSFFFIKKLSLDLGLSDARTVNLTQKHIRGRLAESLLLLKANHGLEEDGATISIYLSREDIANLSNMTTSNAIRTLSNFDNEKVISVDGRRIKIIDEEKLKKISKLG